MTRFIVPTASWAVPFEEEPGSKPLKKPTYERYARLKASGMNNTQAWHKANENNEGSRHGDDVSKRRDVTDRINFLITQEAEIKKLKQARIEEKLWSFLESNVTDLYEEKEFVNSVGKTYTKMVMKKLDDIPQELKEAIEELNFDPRGNPVVKMYSKIQAVERLAKQLGLEKLEPRDTETRRLTNEELVAELAKQANELGVNIDLSYKFSDQDQDAEPNDTRNIDYEPPD